MNKPNHVIFIGGNLSLFGGKVIAGFRLRSAIRKHGYDLMVIDNAGVMAQEELTDLLDAVVTDETLVIGFSTIWLDSYASYHLRWAHSDFFKLLKSKYPHVKFVAGGPENHWCTRGKTIYENCDWVFSGFSDDSFPRFLNYLLKKPDHGFKYFFDNEGKRIVDGNVIFPVPTPDDIETIFDKDDGFLPHQPLPLEVSRGCVFKCSFCHHPFLGVKDPDKYIRTPESIANELKRNYELFGTTRYTILDDTFNDSMEKLDRLHRAIDLSKIPKFEFVSYIKPELLVTKPEMIPKLQELGLASGYMGIESFKSESRKAIRKGMDVNRILDVVSNIRSKTDITFEASFIIGLPHESIEEVSETNRFCTKHRDSLFTGWHFQGMTIYYNKNLEGQSEIDKEPEKFGYEIIEKRPDEPAEWKNKYMNRAQAANYAYGFNYAAAKYRRTAGWGLSTCWHLNIPDDDVKNKTTGELEIIARGVANTRKEAIELLKKYNITVRPYK